MPIAESLAMAALTWVASPVVRNLVTKSIGFLASNITKGLEDLETAILPELQLTIQAAQNSTNQEATTALVKWLARLKGAYIEAECILHKLEYKNLKRKAKEAGDHKNHKWVHISSYPIVKPLVKFVGKVSKKVFLLFKLRRRLNKLKKIVLQAKNFRELLNIETGNGTPAGNIPPATSSHLSNEVFGRDADRDRIIKFLLTEEGGSNSSSNMSYSVVAITGIGGAGKTTLAQYVYSDERVKRHFDVKMWVCLSRNWDVSGCTKEMIESASEGECPNLSNLDTLKNKLIKTLENSKRILLVLDDVWYDKQSSNGKWDDLLAPFYSIRERCKILVTSRSDLFPVAIRPGKHIKLRDLTHDDFLELFMYYAFLGTKINDQQLKNDLRYIGNQIARKMSKSPLAAKVVGNQLSERPDVRFWRDTRGSVNLSSTREILLWSYQRFDESLKQCFLFCGMFPKGTKYPQSLSKLWIALAFVQPTSDDNKTLEDIGIQYFEMMVANSIFVVVNGNYVMHDLFHDLAEKLSQEDCFRLIDQCHSEKPIPPTTLHLFLKGDNEKLKGNLSSITKPNHLHTLFLENPYNEDMGELLSMECTKFKNLRVLQIKSMGLKELPIIGDLKHLRYLNVSYSSIENLPDSICKLYLLQYLLLPDSVKHLPKNISDLSMLRSIDIFKSNGSAVDTLPPVPYLGRLTSLQTLKEFHVRREEGYELQQLGHLREIGGSLRIAGLENVRDKDEAVKARIIDKTKLTGLTLKWKGSTDNVGSELAVIEALQPPPNMEKLTIDGYNCSVYPTWLQEGSTLPILESLHIRNCNALKVLPSNFSQLPGCTELIVNNLEDLRELPAFPENLAKLHIISCSSLILVSENKLPLQVDELNGLVESGFFTSSGLRNGQLHHAFESLQQARSVENSLEQLQIIRSALKGEQGRDVVGTTWNQQMTNLISSGKRVTKFKLPIKLTILYLRRCFITDKAMWNCLKDMASLQQLSLDNILTITTLPPADVLHTLQSLRDLEISSCWYLTSLGGLHALPHLQKLKVTACYGLEMKNNDYALLPPTLQSVSIAQCILSGNIFRGRFPCLHNVIIKYCQVPDSLSFHHLNSLQSLEISYCDVRLIKLCPIISTLALVKVINLDVHSVSESWKGCQELEISSLLMLNKLLLSENIVAPKYVYIYYCEEVISFEKSVHLQSIRGLGFVNCKTKNLQAALSDFSTLEYIQFIGCPEISELPGLPGSVKRIEISCCPVLRKRCQPNGPDWHKIKHLKHKLIE